jgi:predicted GIY-YIG superfamily endonuclease
MPRDRAQTHILYRFFNTAGRLLYVGITNDAATRIQQHEADKAWFRDVTGCTMEHFPTRDALERAEIHAIQTERPKHNIAHATIEPIRMRPSNPSAAEPVFGFDANKFQQPGDDPEDLSFLQRPRLTMPLRCPACGRGRTCFRPADEHGAPIGDQVYCGWCQSDWTVDEWRALVGIPTYNSTAPGVRDAQS